MQYYVYRLIDPRDGQTFYVGRGSGNRVFDHVKGALKYSDEIYQDSDEYGDSSDFSDKVSDKIDQINEIKSAGLEVIHIIHRYGLELNEAKEVEAALIDCYQGLTNIQSGYAAERGVNNANTIQEILKTESFTENADIDFCIIKLHQESVNLYGIYEAVRKSWRINKKRIEKIPYVLAVCNGIVREVYKVKRWLPDETTDGKRYIFEGEEAEDEISKIFLKKKIPQKYMKRDAANPVQYKR